MIGLKTLGYAFKIKRKHWGMEVSDLNMGCGFYSWLLPSFGELLNSYSDSNRDRVLGLVR